MNIMDTKLNADARKHGAGESKKFKAQNSNESVASVIFPWRMQRNGTKKPIVLKTESGRATTTTGFYMCMMSVMLLTSGIGLTAASGWTLIYRIPYVFLSGGSIFLDTDSFTLMAGILSFPCWWIAWMCHNNKKYYTILPVLIGLLWISICLMTTSIVITFFDKLSTNVHGQTYPELHIKQILNGTMTKALQLYDTDLRGRLSWDIVQHRLKCCGKNGPEDWFQVRPLLPCSCFLYNAASSPKVLFVEGCLDRIIGDLILGNSFLTGICLVTMGVHVATLILAALMYLKGRVSRKNTSSVEIT